MKRGTQVRRIDGPPTLLTYRGYGCSFDTLEGNHTTLYPYQYEEIREPHIFDQIMEEMRKHKYDRIHFHVMDDRSCTFTGGDINCNRSFFNLEKALSWLKEHNRDKNTAEKNFDELLKKVDDAVQELKEALK